MRPNPEFAQGTGEFGLLPERQGIVEQGGEGQHEDGVHFVRRGNGREAWGQQGGDRGDDVAGAGDVVGQAAEDFGVGWVEADFFVGFAQGGGFGARVGGVDAAAWKTDLTGVLAQVGGAAGEEDAGGGAGGQADEDGGGGAPGVCWKGRAVMRGSFVATRGGKARPDVGGGERVQLSDGGRSPKGKKVPRLQTPSFALPCTQPGMAMATSS